MEKPNSLIKHLGDIVLIQDQNSKTKRQYLVTGYTAEGYLTLLPLGFYKDKSIYFKGDTTSIETKEVGIKGLMINIVELNRLIKEVTLLFKYINSLSKESKSGLSIDNINILKFTYDISISFEDKPDNNGYMYVADTEIRSRITADNLFEYIDTSIDILRELETRISSLLKETEIAEENQRVEIELGKTFIKEMSNSSLKMQELKEDVESYDKQISKTVSTSSILLSIQRQLSSIILSFIEFAEYPFYIPEDWVLTILKSDIINSDGNLYDNGKANELRNRMNHTDDKVQEFYDCHVRDINSPVIWLNTLDMSGYRHIRDKIGYINDMEEK